jgi:hypothetical protein
VNKKKQHTVEARETQEESAQNAGIETCCVSLPLRLFVHAIHAVGRFSGWVLLLGMAAGCTLQEVRVTSEAFHVKQDCSQCSAVVHVHYLCSTELGL